MNLASMILAACQADSPLERLRRNLSEDDRAALDAALEAVRGYKLTASIAYSPTAMETLLLLIIQKQSQRIESLEFLFQQNARRQLELWTQTAVNEPDGSHFSPAGEVVESP